MNHCVPDSEMEDDDSIPSSSLARSKKPSFLEDEVMELLWQNGQVVMQSQNQRSTKKSPPFKFQDSEQSAAREIRSSLYQHHQQEQQQLVTDNHLFMQEDEMASWLHYPLSDSSFDHDFCADLLYPSAAADAAPCVTSTTVTTSAPPSLGTVSQFSASAVASASRPPIPPLRNELESTRIQNFVHFSRHKAVRAEQSAPSNFKSAIRESTVVDSSDTPAMAPDSTQAMPSNTEAASGGNNNIDGANTSVAAGANTQSAGVSGSANKDNIATCDVTVTSSPGGSSASAELTAQKAAPTEDRKRKGRELDDAECHSEDVEFESTETKKQMRGSTSSKRSRAAEVHNLSERRRRDRINEKMKALQELIPRCNKSDKASMLDEAIEYLKSLQLQVQMMSMGCGMVPMMFPGVQQYMPTMGMGMGMGMDIGRPMMPFPNVLAGSPLPTPAAGAHLGPRFPMPAFHMAPPALPPDPSRIQPSNQSDAMFNPLSMQNPNQQPCVPNFADPYPQYNIGLHPMLLPSPQNQTKAQPSSSRPSTSKGADNIENHPSGDMAR